MSFEEETFEEVMKRLETKVDLFLKMGKSLLTEDSLCSESSLCSEGSLRSERKKSPIRTITKSPPREKKIFRKAKKDNPKYKEKDLIEQNPKFVEAKQKNLELQRRALVEGRILNKICREISPSYEDMIIGHSHKASGIVITHTVLSSTPFKESLYILLVREDGKLVIPGGKGIGEESPWETALREFREEAFYIPEREDVDFKDMFIKSAEFRPGCYTLYHLEAYQVLKPETFSLEMLEERSSLKRQVVEFEQFWCWEKVSDLNGVLKDSLSDFLKKLLEFSPLKKMLKI